MEVTKNPVSSGKLSDPAVRLSPLHSQQEKTGVRGGGQGVGPGPMFYLTICYSEGVGGSINVQSRSYRFKY